MTEYWTPEPIWLGETAFILAGGPSLRDVNLGLLRGRKVLTINSSMACAVDAGLDDGVLFFTDSDWFAPRRDAVAAWRGMVITSSRTARQALPAKVKRIQGELHPTFPKLGAPVVKKGRSSGHTAIGVAAALGVKKIVLLGYDMRVVDDRTHHHDEYRQADVNLYAVSFIPAFRTWGAAAKTAGIEIVNATRDSALTEFPMVRLEEVLNCAPL